MNGHASIKRLTVHSQLITCSEIFLRLISYA